MNTAENLEDLNGQQKASRNQRKPNRNAVRLTHDTKLPIMSVSTLCRTSILPGEYHYVMPL